jgi:hypothetical protein
MIVIKFARCVGLQMPVPYSLQKGQNMLIILFVNIAPVEQTLTHNKIS